MVEQVINGRDLKKQFSKVQALSNVSISVDAGRIVGLIGRSGSGKTTLMKICAGILGKTAGELQVFRAEPMDNIDVLKQLIYSQHNQEYVTRYKLKDIVGQYEKMFPNFDRAFAKKLLSYFSLGEERKYTDLSQGNKSCFNFICALATRAPLTLLDEPTLGMDAAMRKSIYEIILRDQIEFPRTMIISSHLLVELESILSEIILLDQGKVIFHKDIDEVRELAYRVDGRKKDIEAFAAYRNVVQSLEQEMFSAAIILEQLTEDVERDALEQGLSVSKVAPADICVYLTSRGKEAELSCLWEEKN